MPIMKHTASTKSIETSYFSSLYNKLLYYIQGKQNDIADLLARLQA